MIIVDGANYRVGLALSGGGFRASIFHMGVLRRLHELAVLQKVDVVSTVSGGSIVGAFFVLGIAAGKSFEDLEAQFHGALKANVRFRALTGSAVFHPVRSVRALLPGYTRTNITASEYNRLLFQGTKLDDLPDHPKLIINATSLNTGQVWKFSKEEMGDYRFGFADSRDVPLCDAVGASSAVPGIVPPLIVSRKYLEDREFSDGCLEEKIERVALSDGGVRDNQGVISVLSEECDYVICSDASGLIDTKSSPGTLAGGVLLRSNSITMDAARDLIVSKVFEKRDLQQIRQVVFFDMEDEATGGAPGILRGLRSLAANTRTDVDWFSDEEIETIRYHGYTLLDQKAQKYGFDLVGGDLPALNEIEYSDDKIKQVANAMRKSNRRRIRVHRFS